MMKGSDRSIERLRDTGYVLGVRFEGLQNVPGIEGSVKKKRPERESGFRVLRRPIDRNRVVVVVIRPPPQAAHARATSGPTTESTRSRGLREHRLNLISG